MRAEYADVPQLLTAHGLLPADTLAVYLCGSMARGWGNARSDIDLVVVVPTVWISPTAGELRVPLEPAHVPFETLQIEGQHTEVKYWLDHQILQVVKKASWQAYNGARAVHERLTQVEENLLGRLLACVPITGASWIVDMNGRIRESAFQAIMVDRVREQAQEAATDARGQLEAGDTYSAVLSARIALGHSVDAFTLSRGEFDRAAKWRARRVRELAAPELPFDHYWSLETAQELHGLAPATWVSSVLEFCGSLTTGLSSPSLEG